MMTKGQKQEEKARLYSAWHCYFMAAVAMAMFAYSFLVPESSGAKDYLTRTLENDHYAILLNWRWYFLAGSILSVVVALKSVHRANGLRRGLA